MPLTPRSLCQPKYLSFLRGSEKVGNEFVIDDITL